MAQITVDEVEKLRIKDQDLVLIDVRSAKVFEKGSIPGAINIPFEELENRQSEIDSDNQIILFCNRGGKSSRAVKLLEDLGVYASDIQGGYEGWIEASK